MNINNIGNIDFRTYVRLNIDIYCLYIHTHTIYIYTYYIYIFFNVYIILHLRLPNVVRFHIEKWSNSAPLCSTEDIQPAAPSDSEPLKSKHA